MFIISLSCSDKTVSMAIGTQWINVVIPDFAHNENLKIDIVSIFFFFDRFDGGSFEFRPLCLPLSQVFDS